MTKYASLETFLRAQKNAIIPITFSDIEKVVGHPLPRSAKYPAWWSNNPSNNVMTKVWLNAGFKTEQVDVAAKKLVFRRVVAETSLPKGSTGMAEPARPFARGRHPLRGALKGFIRLVTGTDLTKPADPHWGKT